MVQIIYDGYYYTILTAKQIYMLNASDLQMKKNRNKKIYFIWLKKSLFCKTTAASNMNVT